MNTLGTLMTLHRIMTFWGLLKVINLAFSFLVITPIHQGCYYTDNVKAITLSAESYLKSRAP
jgi:hypothetical protein